MSDGASLSHFDAAGAARMVEVSAKPESHRRATASAVVTMAPTTLTLITDRKVKKGDVFEVARLAGIMAAKKTPDLIPLCHPLPLSGVTVDFEVESEKTVRIRATVTVFSRTGVEMEALTAVSVAALTIYDIGKSVDRGVTIGPIGLDAKSGGQSGQWPAAGESP